MVLSSTQLTHLNDIANRKLDTLCKQASDALSFKVNKPTLSLDQRGKIAGSAILQRYHIRLNKILFWQNQSVYLDTVLAHELAHLIVYERYGKTKPHGHQWQSIMTTVFELPADVTHALDTKDVAQKSVRYYCQCGEVQLSLIRHNKVLKGTQQYSCRQCKMILKQGN